MSDKEKVSVNNPEAVEEGKRQRIDRLVCEADAIWGKDVADQLRQKLEAE